LIASNGFALAWLGDTIGNRAKSRDAADWRQKSPFRAKVAAFDGIVDGMAYNFYGLKYRRSEKLPPEDNQMV
jgi:hypothetical protein